MTVPLSHHGKVGHMTVSFLMAMSLVVIVVLCSGVEQCSSLVILVLYSTDLVCNPLILHCQVFWKRQSIIGIT